MADTTFTTGTTITSEWLNDVNDAVYNGTLTAEGIQYTPPFTGGVTETVEAKLAQIVSIKDFGAVGNGATDDTAAIQAAIDAANAAGGGTVVVPDGVFLLGAYTYTGVATGVSGILLKSNVTLQLNGTLKAKDGIYGAGAFYAMIRTLDAGVSNAHITGTGTIDGNKANQVASTQCSNVLLECVDNVSVRGIYVKDANGNGIMLRGTVSTYATNLRVENTIVTGATSIGIQCSQFDGLVITGNVVKDCTDNCIDIYGEDGTTTCHGKNATITGNSVKAGSVGIFCETVRDVVVSGNSIDSCTAIGITVNRINGAPKNVNITGNTIIDCPIGYRSTGTSEGVTFRGNTIRGFTDVGVRLGASGTSGYNLVEGNTFIPPTNTTNLINVAGTNAIANVVKDNFITTSTHNPANYLSFTASARSGGTYHNPDALIFIQPAKKYFYPANVVSGGTATFTVPATTAGRITLLSNSGGSWWSVWSGSYVASASRVSVVQEGTTFTNPGNFFASVAGSSTTLNITITFAASGSGGNWYGWMEYI